MPSHIRSDSCLRTSTLSPFQVLFEEFKAYYGEATFPNAWVTGALGGTEAGSGAGGATTKVTSANGHVADFETVNDDATREQAIKKGTVQMILWPYAIHELESAQGKCGTDEEGSLHYLDEAVAFYTGSLVGEDATGATKGKLMFGLSQSRCKDFVTCGDGASTSGLATSNKKVFAKFDEFKAAIKASNCGALKGLTKEITDAGYTAIIQGTLKYGSVVGKGGASAKYKAEAATFAMAILPRVNTCSAASAKTIYDNLMIGAASTDFAAVQAALEANYACMGVTCADVGAYTKDGEQLTTPCSDGLGAGPLIGIIAGGVVAVGVLVGVLVKTGVLKLGGKAAAKTSSAAASSTVSA